MRRKWLGGDRPGYFRVKGVNSHGEAYGEPMWFNTGTHEWGLQPTEEPFEATGSSLSSVSCASASACVATGRYPDANWVWRPLAEGWNGSKWSLQSTSAPPTVEEAKKEEEGEAGLTGGVSCTSATACTAVGSYRLPSFAQWSLVEVRH